MLVSFNVVVILRASDLKLISLSEIADIRFGPMMTKY